MFDFFKRIVGAGRRALSGSPDPSQVHGPATDRERIIEGSTEPTYLKPNSELQAAIARLYCLEVEISYGDAEDRNLVADLYAGFQTGKFPELTQVTQYLASQTIEHLSRLDDDKLNQQSFIMGAVDTSRLLNAISMSVFVKNLTLNYPDYKVLTLEFDTTAIVGANLSNRTIDQEALDELFVPRASSIGGEQDRASRLDLLKIITETLDQVGEPVSFGRLKFLNPYIPGIANCHADRRCEIVRKIFEEEYPFTRDNQNAWPSEIASAMGS